MLRVVQIRARLAQGLTWQTVSYTEADSFFCVCVCVYWIRQQFIEPVVILFCSLLFEIFINLVHLSATLLETIQIHSGRPSP